jgi:hypothetical protein
MILQYSLSDKTTRLRLYCDNMLSASHALVIEALLTLRISVEDDSDEDNQVRYFVTIFQN